jgi:cell division protein FtsZ
MSELNEFMAQMTEDEIDVKWGITIDNSLGEQLKITIVATGFGVQGVLDAVDEESISGLSDETSNDMVKSELEMEREDVAIDSYYGDGRRVSMAPKLNSRTQSAQSKEEIIEEPAVVIFTNDEDEDEDIPAYKRKSKLNEESNFSSFSSSTSGFSLDDDGNVSDKNKFLFDNVD